MLFLLAMLFSLPCLAEEVAVLDFRGSGGQEDLLPLLTDNARAGVLEAVHGLDDSKLMVLAEESMDARLRRKRRRRRPCKGLECEAGLARKAGVEYILAGELSELGGLYVLTVTLHATRSGRLLAQEEVRERDIGLLLDGSKGAGRRAVVSGLGLAEAPEPSPVEQQAAEAPPPLASSPVAAAPPEAPLSMGFVSEPAGAKVLVNGQLLCPETPCRAPVPPGFHELRFQKDRYSDFARNFNAKAGEVLSGSLAPLFGWIDVSTTPMGLEARMDGESLGRTPIHKMEVDPGFHVIEVGFGCYEPVSYRFQAFPGEYKKDIFIPPLKARRAGLNVHAYADGEAVEGDVYVDGEKAGIVAQVIDISLCADRVEVRDYDGRSWSGELKLETKEVQVLEVELE
jgi:hypothetical protein